MTNTITDLIPIMYKGLDIVAREMVGFIPACQKDANAEAVPMGTYVDVPIVPVNTTATITPGNVPAEPSGQTIPYVQMAITKSKSSRIGWNGEQMKAYRTNGTYESTLANQFAQALRALVNEVEVDLGIEAALISSRAYGTANTNPFATAADMTDFAQIRKILEDNGSPTSDLHLVLNSGAIANLRGKMSNLFKASEAGTDLMLRTGALFDIDGMQIHQSAGVAAPAIGNAVMSVNATGYPIGATDLTCTYTSGAFAAGDVITIAGDTNKYIVVNALGSAGVLKIQAPGLRQAIPTSAQVITTIGKSARNIALQRSALILLARQPAMPAEGDLADDVYVLTDPVSGISFQVARYKMYRQVMYEVGLAWGVKGIKSEFSATLLGAY